MYSYLAIRYWYCTPCYAAGSTQCTAVSSVPAFAVKVRVPSAPMSFTIFVGLLRLTAPFLARNEGTAMAARSVTMTAENRSSEAFYDHFPTDGFDSTVPSTIIQPVLETAGQTPDIS